MKGAAADLRYYNMMEVVKKREKKALEEIRSGKQEALEK